MMANLPILKRVERSPSQKNVNQEEFNGSIWSPSNQIIALDDDKFRLRGRKILSNFSL